MSHQYQYQPQQKHTTKVTTPSSTISTSSSSCLEDHASSSTTAAPTSTTVMGGVDREIHSGGWKWSKPRQIAFWVKNSVRNVVTPDLSSIYESPPSPKRRTTHKHKPKSPTTPTQQLLSTLEPYNVNLFSDRTTLASLTATTEEGGEEEEVYLFPPCRTIDDAMAGLHTLVPSDAMDECIGEGEEGMMSADNRTMPCFEEYYTFAVGGGGTNGTVGNGGDSGSHGDYSHDWMLDGDLQLPPYPPSSHPTTNHPYTNYSQPRRHPSYTTTNNNTNTHPRQPQSLPQTPIPTTSNPTPSPTKTELDTALASMELELSDSNEAIDNNDTTDQQQISAHNPADGMGGLRPQHMRCDTTTHDHDDDSHDDDDDDEEGENDIPKNLVMTTCITPDHTRLSFPNPWGCATTASSVGELSSKGGGGRQSSGLLGSLPLADVCSPEARFVRRIQLLEDEEEEEEEEYRVGHLVRDESQSPPLQEEEEVGYSPDDFGDGRVEEEDDILSPLYYTEDYDPMYDILNSIPWDAADDSANDDEDDESIIRIDAYLSQTLSELDEASQKINQKLVREISKREGEINAGMKRIQDVDFDVSGALVSVRQANVFLQRARGKEVLFRSSSLGGTGGTGGTASGCSGGGGGGTGAGILGGVYVIEMADKRDRLREVDSILASCQEILDMDQRVTAFSKTEPASTEGFTTRAAEFRELVGICTGWIVRLSKTTVGGMGEKGDNLPLDQLTCFEELRERVLRAMVTLRRYLDGSIVFFVSKLCNRRICCDSTMPSSQSSTTTPILEKFDEDCYLEYCTLVDAHYMLHDERHALEVNEKDDGMQQEIPIADTLMDNAASSLSKCITKALCFEVDRCLARALLDPTKNATSDYGNTSDGDGEASSDFDRNLLEIRSKIVKIQASDEDAASLRALTHNLMVIRFQFEDRKNFLPWVYHKLCVLLANVLHTHYLLTRWPRCPSDNDVDDGTCDILVNDKSKLKELNCEGRIAPPIRGEPGGQRQRSISSSSTTTTYQEESHLSVSSNPTSLPSPPKASRHHMRHESDVPRCISATSMITTTTNKVDRNKGNKRLKRHRQTMHPPHLKTKNITSYHRRLQRQQNDARLGEISNEILKSRLELWRHCESIIIHFLETSTSFLSSRKNVDHADTGNGSNDTASCGPPSSGSSTMLHIEHLHDVLHLSNQMITLAREFVGSEICKSERIVPMLCDDNNDDDNSFDGGLNCSGSSSTSCMIKEKICVILRANLRRIHVEAMTEMGNMLAHESWQVVSYPLNNSTMEETRTAATTSGEQVQQCIEKMLVDNSPLPNDNDYRKIIDRAKLRTWHNLFYLRTHQESGCSSETSFLPNFFSAGNPFLNNDDDISIMGFNSTSHDYASTKYHYPADEEEKKNDDNNHAAKNRNNLYDKVASCIDPNATQLTIATKSSIQMVRWTSRLFQLLEKLPIIQDDVSIVICNIYDLYYLTVFRLCMGNKMSERIVLGLEQRSDVNDFSLPLQQHQRQHQQHQQQQQLPPSRHYQRQHQQHQQQQQLPPPRHSSRKINFGRRQASLDNLTSSTHGIHKRRISSDNLQSCASNNTIGLANYHSLKNIEADIYSPLRSENNIAEKARVFLERGQTSLSDIVNLDKIEGWSSNTAPLPRANAAGGSTTNTNNNNNDINNNNINDISREEMMYEALVMQKRIIASFSCLFVSCVFDSALHRLKRVQCSPTFQSLFGGVTDQQYQQQMSCGLPTPLPTATTVGVAPCTELNSSLVEYWTHMLDASAHIHLLCMRMSTIRAIKGEHVVHRIISIGSGWAAETLNESCNEYVDMLSERCTLLWGHMSLHSSFLAHESMLLQAWDHIIESCFVSILEGFSRVYCSTEGRASMSIDLATFCASVNGRAIESRLESYFQCVGRLPPSSAPRRGMQYVDLYVKVFYFPEDDVMKWIIENRHLYHLSHLLALVSFGMIQPVSQGALLREQIKSL